MGYSRRCIVCNSINIAGSLSIYLSSISKIVLFADINEDHVAEDYMNFILLSWKADHHSLIIIITHYNTLISSK